MKYVTEGIVWNESVPKFSTAHCMHTPKKQILLFFLAILNCSAMPLVSAAALPYKDKRRMGTRT